jgi:predicted PurR-regulated permease PerM
MAEPIDDAVRLPGMPRGLVVILALTGLLVSMLALRQFSGVVAPVLLALVLTIAMHPLTGKFIRWGLPKWLATTLTLLATFAIIIALAVSMAYAIARLGTLLPRYEHRFAGLLTDLREWLATLGIGSDQLRTVLSEISFGKVAGIAANLLVGLASTFSNLLFLLLIVLFMGIDAARFPDRLRETGARRTALVTALAGFARGTRRYLVVATVFGLIVAVLDSVVLWLLGVPLAVLWGLLAFVTNYIPNIGFVLGLVPPALLALLEGGPDLMIIVIVAYSVINFVIQSVIQPKFVADAVELSLTVEFISLMFWTFVIGPLGAILAIPLTLLAKALLLEADPDTRWMSALLTGGPVARTPDEAAGRTDDTADNTADDVADDPE